MLRAVLCVSTVMLFATNAFAQTRVTGKIVDASGNPIPGATVMVKGASIGTNANGSGSYTINAQSASSVLVFSFVGYETVEETVGSRTVIDVTLAEASVQLESVVSIGYGVRRKSDLTGAIASVDSEALVAKGTSSVMEALQGQIPGVIISQSSTRAGGGFSMQIRGQNSLAGGSPLYVVDGIVVDDINFINPADIERVDVMKDASSNAIYGSRGSNGVVQITTKQASSASKERISISYDGYVGFANPVRLPNYMNADEFWNYRLMCYTQFDRNPTTGDTRYYLRDSDINTAIISPTVVERYLDPSKQFDYLGEAFKPSFQQNHFLSLSGTSGNNSYTFSAGYTGEDGSYDNDWFKRVTVRGGYQTKIQDILTLGFQTNISYTVSEQGSRSAVRDLLRMVPFAQPRDEDGNLIPNPMSGSALNSVGYSGAQYSSQYNPYLDIENERYNVRNSHILTNVFADLALAEGLRFRTQFSPSIRSGRTGEYQGILTSVRNSIGTDAAAISRREFFDYTWDNSVNYTGSTGDHNYDATAVYSVYYSRFETAANAGEDLSVPSFHGISTATVFRPATANFRQSAMLSFIARVNYSYKSKYLLTLSNRWDGSSKLANKWDSFPSAAIGWRMNEEDFLKDANWLVNLKLRASYGYTGNNNINPYMTQTNLSSAKRWYGFGTSQAIGYGRGVLGNTELGWEKTREFNVGLDFAIFKGRISGTFDWYDKLSDGLLMNRILPIETGAPGSSDSSLDPVITDNVGSVRNRGIEVGLSTINVRNKNVNWTTNLTFTRNRNEIISLYGKKEDVIAERRFIGQPINVAYTYVYDGVVNAERARTDFVKRHGVSEGSAIVKDLNDNGVIDAGDRTITGTGFSDWVASFGSSLKVRNFDFSFNIYADFGRYVRSRYLAEALNFGERARAKIVVDHYVPENIDVAAGPSWYTAMTDKPALDLKPNTSGTFPYPYAPGNTTYFKTNDDDYQNGFVDASYVKVKNITLGYTLPKAWVEKAKLSHVRIYANVLNPFVFTKDGFMGFDPEWANSDYTGQSNNIGGAAMCIWQFGMNIKF